LVSLTIANEDEHPVAELDAVITDANAMCFYELKQLLDFVGTRIPSMAIVA
jgi:hypothetical protein